MRGRSGDVVFCKTMGQTVGKENVCGFSLAVAGPMVVVCAVGVVVVVSEGTDLVA